MCCRAASRRSGVGSTRSSSQGTEYLAKHKVASCRDANVGSDPCPWPRTETIEKGRDRTGPGDGRARIRRQPQLKCLPSSSPGEPGYLPPKCRRRVAVGADNGMSAETDGKVQVVFKGRSSSKIGREMGAPTPRMLKVEVLPRGTRRELQQAGPACSAQCNRRSVQGLAEGTEAEHRSPEARAEGRETPVLPVFRVFVLPSFPIRSWVSAKLPQLS